MIDPRLLSTLPAIPTLLSRTLPALVLALLGACSTAGPNYQPHPLSAPAHWQAPLIAHNGDTATLAQWWDRFNDTALIGLIEAAQRESATLALAAARIEQARAAAVTAAVANQPSLEGIATGNRAAFSFGGPAQRRTLIQLGPQSSWEIDLFGGLARGREAAAATLQSNQAAWHDARVSLAAEVAEHYLNLRHCEAQLALAQEDLQTRRDTARITALALAVGLQPRTALLAAQAGAAQAADAMEQRRAQCDIVVKGLVALTAMDEPALRALLAPATARIPQATTFNVDTVPARAIAQRPDIAMAERDLATASARIGVAEAARYPSLSLTGNILPSLASLNGSALASVMTWAFGPALSLPLADGGRRTANVDAAKAQFTALDTTLRAKVRGAVREVEEALVRLNAAGVRARETAQAYEALNGTLEATRARVKTGLASQLELLDAQRNTLNANTSVVQARQEQASAWIALYRAVGGGWDGQFAVVAKDAPAAPAAQAAQSTQAAQSAQAALSVPNANVTAPAPTD